MRALRIYYKNSLIFKFYSQELLYFTLVPFLEKEEGLHEWTEELSERIQLELRSIDGELRMLQLQDLDINEVLLTGERRESVAKATHFVDFIEKIRAAEPEAAAIPGFLQYSVS